MKNLLNIKTIILCVWLSWGCTDAAQNRESGDISCDTPIYIIKCYDK